MKLNVKIYAAALTTLTGLALVACGADSRVQVEGEEAALRVRTQLVERRQIDVTSYAVGTTEPYARAAVAAQLMARITAADFEEGEPVRVGQVLVRLDDAALQAVQDYAQAELAAAHSARLLAEKNALRLRNLYDQEAVSQQALDDAETALARAAATEKSARQKLRQAEVQRTYSSIASPLNGHVVRKLVDVGDMATPGAPLFIVEQIDSLKVEVSLPEDRRVAADQRVQVEIEALGQRVEGRVLAQVQAADPRSRTFRAKIAIGNVNDRIGSGMYARALLPEAPRDALLVPSTALVRKGQLQGVYAVSNGRAQLRWLRLGGQRGAAYEVLSGLDEGDEVVVDPPTTLRAGRRVEAYSND